MNRILKLLTVIFAVFLFGSVASARQDDERLDRLFDELTETKDAVKAQAIERVIWNIWMRSGSDTIDLLMIQGLKDMAAGAYQKANMSFTMIIDMDPEFAEAWNKRATVRFLVGDLNGSLEDVARVLELEPRHFGAFAGLGQIFEIRNAPEQALSAFEKALRINPHMPSIRRKLKILKHEHEGQKI
ncbi:MAG: tetratricopeptide (TPR) repeat protein [Sneathiella sp.]|jgi:tetratricopeptide (TPR) repeat protein